jgi:hypothetical protein
MRCTPHAPKGCAGRAIRSSPPPLRREGASPAMSRLVGCTTAAVTQPLKGRGEAGEVHVVSVKGNPSCSFTVAYPGLVPGLHRGSSGALRIPKDARERGERFQHADRRALCRLMVSGDTRVGVCTLSGFPSAGALGGGPVAVAAARSGAGWRSPVLAGYLYRWSARRSCPRARAGRGRERSDHGQCGGCGFSWSCRSCPPEPSGAPNRAGVILF